MIFKLARSALLYDKLLNFCLIASLCAVILPLLILFSLRYGIISGIEEELKTNPLKLEIKIRSERIHASFFDELASLESSDFVLPLTRGPSALVDIKTDKKTRLRVETLPTKKGDPVVLKSNLDDSLGAADAFISEDIAYEMGLVAGDEFTLLVSRKIDGRSECARILMTVKGVVSRDCLISKLLLNYDTFIKMEDYRDGYEPSVISDGSNPRDVRDYFNGARIYAKSIDDIEAVHNFIVDKGFSVASDNLSAVNEFHSIENALNYIFSWIARASIGGGLFAVLGLCATNLSRRRKSFALLSLTGLKRGSLILMVVLENFILSTIAYGVSVIALYFAMEHINEVFKAAISSESMVSTLKAWHYTAGYLITAGAVSAVSAAVAAFMIGSLDEAKTLREV